MTPTNSAATGAVKLSPREQIKMLDAMLAAARAREAELIATLERAEQDFDKVAEAYLAAGNNQGAGALQYASGYMRDVLAALSPNAKEADHD